MSKMKLNTKEEEENQEKISSEETQEKISRRDTEFHPKK